MAAPSLFSNVRIGLPGFTSTFVEYDAEVTPEMANEMSQIDFNNDQQYTFKTISSISVNILNSSITSDTNVNKALGSYSKIVFVGVSGGYTLSFDNVQLTMIQSYEDPRKFVVTGRASVAQVGTAGAGAFAIS